MNANPWVWLAVAGSLIGVCGGAFGTYMAISKAETVESRRFVVRNAVSVLLLVAALLSALAVSPDWLRPWLFGAYSLILVWFLKRENAVYARIVQEQHTTDQQDGLDEEGPGRTEHH